MSSSEVGDCLLSSDAHTYQALLHNRCEQRHVPLCCCVVQACPTERPVSLPWARPCPQEKPGGRNSGREGGMRGNEVRRSTMHLPPGLDCPAPPPVRPHLCVHTAQYPT